MVNTASREDRVTIPDLHARKGGVPVVCLTAYTTPMAKLLDPYVDLLLVGDSLGMVLYGIAQGLEGPAPIAYVSDVSPREKQAVAQSAARSLGDLALFSAPPLMGMASDMVGTTVTLYGNAVFMVVITVLFATLASDPVRQIVRARRAAAAERADSGT